MLAALLLRSLALLVAASFVSAVVYEPTEGFCDNNPNGPWQYGYKEKFSAPFLRFNSTGLEISGESGVCIQAHLNNTGYHHYGFHYNQKAQAIGRNYYGKQLQIWFNSDFKTEVIMLRFTVPQSKSYNVDVRFFGIGLSRVTTLIIFNETCVDMRCHLREVEDLPGSATGDRCKFVRNHMWMDAGTIMDIAYWNPFPFFDRVQITAYIEESDTVSLIPKNYTFNKEGAISALHQCASRERAKGKMRDVVFS